jgi:hypothetical protein
MTVGRADDEYCALCDDGRFVCENHPKRPFFGQRACSCGGAGMACPECNASEVTVPEMPDDFREDAGEAGHYLKCPKCAVGSIAATSERRSRMRTHRIRISRSRQVSFAQEVR